MLIKIPFKTPSANKLYGKTSRHNSVYLRPEAKKLKAEIREIVISAMGHGEYDLGKMRNETKLYVSVEIHEDWYFKNGNVRTCDVSNREKFLIDSVFEPLGIDDKFIFEYNMKKVQDKEGYAMISIEVLNENSG